MSAKEVAEGVLNHYTITRGAGHTALAFKSCVEYKGGTVTFVVANEEQARTMQSRFYGVNAFHVVVVTLSDFTRGCLSSGVRNRLPLMMKMLNEETANPKPFYLTSAPECGVVYAPVVFDNYAIQTVLRELLDANNKLAKKLKESGEQQPAAAWTIPDPFYPGPAGPSEE